MKGRLTLSGAILLVVGLLLLVVFGWATYTSVYDCEHLTGGVPIGGCEYFLQLPVYLWSGSPILFLGISAATVGAALIIVGRLITGPAAAEEITRQ